MRDYVAIVVCGVCLVLAALPVAAQTGGAGEASGRVVDAEGSPVVGAVVTFVNPASPDVEYRATTNKKGRYYVPGLLFNEASKRWDMTVEAEGLRASHVNVISRTQNAVLDKFEAEIKPGQRIPGILIGGFGKVTADVVLGPEQDVAEIVPLRQPTEAAVISDTGPPPGSDPWAAAVARANAGDLEASLPLFEKAIEQKPEDAERHTAHAQVLYQLERYGPAAKQAMRATQLAPESLEAQMVLYSVYVSSNNLAAAGAALQRAREIAPEDRRVLEQAAWLADQSGDAEQAVAAYEAITRVDPGNADAWTALGGLYAEAGRNADSETAYQKVVELNPDDAYQVFFNIGALIMNRKNLTDADTRKAVDAFRRAIEIKPDYAQAHQQLAFALLGTGDLAGARASLQRYVELRPNAPDAADMKALLQGLDH